MNFVFTGPAIVNGLHLERKYLIALAEEKGHKVQKSVTLATDYIVCDPSKFTGTMKTKKIKDAVNIAISWPKNIKTINYEVFLKKMGFL